MPRGNTKYKNEQYGQEIKGAPEQFKFYHPHANVLEIYGNTSGFSTFGSEESGGSLISPLSNHLNVSENVLKKRTFQQLLHPVQVEVHKNSGGNQNVQIYDTTLGYDLYLGIHK